MKKLSSYQKMKLKYEKQIADLTNDIITLVEEKDLEKTLITKLKWKTSLDLEEQIWMGDSNN